MGVRQSPSGKWCVRTCILAYRQLRPWLQLWDYMYLFQKWTIHCLYSILTSQVLTCMLSSTLIDEREQSDTWLVKMCLQLNFKNVPCCAIFTCVAKGESRSRSLVTPSVCSSVRPKILSSQLLWNYWSDFHETWYVNRTSCYAYRQEILIPSFLWELYPLEL